MTQAPTPVSHGYCQRSLFVVAAVLMSTVLLDAFGPVSTAAAEPPGVQMPFPCGEVWSASTYPGHGGSGYAVDWNLSGQDDFGRSVRAGASGTVTVVGYQAGGYGNWVEVAIADGWTLRYGHLSSVSVVDGQSVVGLTEIGKVGSTGHATGPHLHYEQRHGGAVQWAGFNGTPVDYGATPPGIQRTSQNCSDSPAPTAHDDPNGSFDSASGEPGGVRLTGWAYDADAPSTALTVHVYQGPCCTNPVGAFTANTSRPDAGAAFPGTGDNHGFDIPLSLPTGVVGRRTYCAYAINDGIGGNTFLGCRSLTVGPNVEGTFDSGQAVAGGAELRGWTIDPDVSGPTDVHIFEGRCCAHPRAIVPADLPRADVGAARVGYGDAHGFDTVVSLAAGHHVLCVYGINEAGTPGRETDLGCRSVTVR